MLHQKKFIVVDDDYINNILSRIIIEMIYPQADFHAYMDPETALAYIRSAYSEMNALDTVLFLDINMPKVNAWEFLDAFEELEDNIKSKLNLYVLSSSVDPRDKKRAIENKNVLDYIEKPLTKESVERVTKKIIN